MLNIVFVCSGNTCRSPMAMAIATSYKGRETEGMSFTSRGISVSMPERANRNAVSVIKTLCGFDLGPHVARQLTKEEIAGADMIIVMTRSHKNYLEHVYNHAVGKVLTLYEIAGQRQKDVEDPYGMDAFVYKQLADTFKRIMDRAFWLSVRNKIGKDIEK